MYGDMISDCSKSEYNSILDDYTSSSSDTLSTMTMTMAIDYDLSFGGGGSATYKKKKKKMAAVAEDCLPSKDSLRMVAVAPTTTTRPSLFLNTMDDDTSEDSTIWKTPSLVSSSPSSSPSDESSSPSSSSLNPATSNNILCPCAGTEEADNTNNNTLTDSQKEYYSMASTTLNTLRANAQAEAHQWSLITNVMYKEHEYQRLVQKSIYHEEELKKIVSWENTIMASRFNTFNAGDGSGDDCNGSCTSGRV